MNTNTNNFFNNLPEHDCLISDRIALIWDSEEIISSLDHTKGSTTYEVEGPYGCIFAVIADNPAEAQELCVSIMGYDYEDYHIMGVFRNDNESGSAMKEELNFIKQQIQSAYISYEWECKQIDQDLKAEEISADSIDLMYESAEKSLKQALAYLVCQARLKGFSYGKIREIFQKEYEEGIID